jgi:hypothetical protein
MPQKTNTTFPKISKINVKRLSTYLKGKHSSLCFNPIFIFGFIQKMKRKVASSTTPVEQLLHLSSSFSRAPTTTYPSSDLSLLHRALAAGALSRAPPHSRALGFE